MFGTKISCESCCNFARHMMQQKLCVTSVVNLSDPSCDFTSLYCKLVPGGLMFGIKISCESCCDFARPLMQQMFCATRLVNLSDLSCGFTQAYVANVCQVG